MPDRIVPAIPAAGQDLARAIVHSVALSILLAKDFAPRSRPPPIADLVAMELPRVLACTARVNTVRARLGGFAVTLDAVYAPDPVGMVREYIDKVCTDAQATQDAIQFLEQSGHHDFVFGVLKYTRKPPTATGQSLRAILEGVGDELRVPRDDDAASRIERAYTAAHHELARV